jgi:hypothetical protein
MSSAPAAPRGLHHASTSRAPPAQHACLVMRVALSLPALRGKRRQRQHSIARASADWDAEMSLFRKRLSSPNQLATMRLLEAQVDVGRVRPRSSSLPVLMQGGETKDRHVAPTAPLPYHRPKQTLRACPHNSVLANASIHNLPPPCETLRMACTVAPGN